MIVSIHQIIDSFACLHCVGVKPNQSVFNDVERVSTFEMLDTSK